VSSSQIDVYRECRAMGMTKEQTEQVNKTGLEPDAVIRQLKRIAEGQSDGSATLSQANLRKDSGAFDCLLGPFDSKYGVLNTRRVHVVCGNSGAGKTIWTNQMLVSQLETREFLGRVGAGWEFLCLWADRGEEDITEQLTCLDMMQHRHRHHAVSMAKSPAQTVEDAVIASPAKAVFVEGVDMWAEDSTSKRAVAQLMGDLRAVAVHYDISILLSVGSQKFKPKEQYQHTRARVSGADSWVRMAHTCVNVAEDPSDGVRTITIDARTGPKQVVKMQFEEDGRLHIVPTAVEIGPEVSMEQWFAQHPSATCDEVQAQYHIKKRRANQLRKKYAVGNPTG
jgi:hypothetical protein